jgi:hypothetical protein
MASSCLRPRIFRCLELTMLEMLLCRCQISDASFRERLKDCSGQRDRQHRHVAHFFWPLIESTVHLLLTPWMLPTRA